MCVCALARAFVCACKPKTVPVIEINLYFLCFRVWLKFSSRANNKAQYRHTRHQWIYINRANTDRPWNSTGRTLIVVLVIAVKCGWQKLLKRETKISSSEEKLIPKCDIKLRRLWSLLILISTTPITSGPGCVVCSPKKLSFLIRDLPG